MKRKFRVSFILIIALAMLATTIVAAAASSYDTTNDPIVVYSGMVKWAEETFRPSINEKIDQSVASLQTTLNDTQTKLSTAEQTIAALRQELNALTQKLEALDNGSQTPTVDVSGYEVVYLTQGTQLLANSVCNIILRSGSATVISPFYGASAQGLTDITDGSELLNGDAIQKNHLLVVPRGNDGRGIYITSADGAYILVQGGYQLVQP